MPPPNIAHGSFHPFEVFKISWWMRHYGACTPKRHVGLCKQRLVWSTESREIDQEGPGKDAPRKRLWNTYPNLDVQVIKALQRWKALSFLPVFWDCICICPCKVYMRNKIEYWDGPRIIPYLKFCWPSKNPASNCDCSWLGFIGVAPRRDPLVVLYSIAPLTYLPNKTKVLSSKICLLHFSSKL